eukprot:4714680-Pleurochrysis_carterae.AAC.3
MPTLSRAASLAPFVDLVTPSACAFDRCVSDQEAAPKLILTFAAVSESKFNKTLSALFKAAGAC